ncbi:sulfotransferase family protein [Reinekea marinisedimentorum]|nr:sulfotransferase [Reinekea marinisedimentorum]
MIVGAPRSGSTYLMENLLTHPQVFIPTPKGGHSTGDLHFFDVGRKEGRGNYAKGLDWYLSLYSSVEENQIAGEKTADYLADAEACKLIHEAFGSIKIVALLRDPVTRAYSHFWHERHNLGKYNTFPALLSYGKDVGDAKILSSGLYHDSLQRYQSIFGVQNVHIIIFEDLHQDPAKELQRLCQFLEIDGRYSFPLKNAQINKGTTSKKIELLRHIATSLQEYSPHIYDWCRNSFLADEVRNYFGKQRGTRQYAGESKDASKKVSIPSLKDNEISTLRDFYREDVIKLGSLLGRNMQTCWWHDSK